MIPVALVAAAALAAAPPVSQAFPTFMLIRGPGLEQPVLLYHRGARTVMMHLGGDTTRPKVRVGMMLESPIFWFYSDQQQRSQIVPEEYRDALRSYEIAEFWGWGADDEHRPHRPLVWEEAGQYSMLHVRPGTAPIYVRSSGTPMPQATGGILGDSAVVYLERWGVPMAVKGN